MPDDEDERTDPHLRLPESRPVSSKPPRGWTTLPPPKSPFGGQASSAPPTRIPRPSDPPPPRAPATPGVAERQRLMQMQTQLDEARSTIARQRNELDELRERVADGDRRLGELVESLRSDPRSDALGDRLRSLEERRDEVGRRLAQAELDGRERGGLIDRLQTRLSEFEEGEAARIRMRLERLAAQVQASEERTLRSEHSQHFLRERVAKIEERVQAQSDRSDQITASMDELGVEVREHRDASDADHLRARLDALEALVLSTGTEEAKLRREVASLRDSVAPPPLIPGDDLTRIKGVGPKFARMLVDAGVTTFAEVASWKADDLERYAALLGIKASRIEKAGWIEAAANLRGDQT